MRVRLPEGAEIRWSAVAALAAYLVATVVLAFLVPAVGWMLIALTILTAGVLINPASRKRRRGGRRRPF